MKNPTDGDAVAMVRSRLQARSPGGVPRIRSTVVPGDLSGWVVRTWTTTPDEQTRPVGRPQFVHRVTRDPAADAGLLVELVWSEPGAD
jgi:hypothetical protein